MGRFFRGIYQLVTKLFSICQDYHRNGYDLQKIFLFCDEIRLKNQGLNADWGSEAATTPAFRNHLAPIRKETKGPFRLQENKR